MMKCVIGTCGHDSKLTNDDGSLVHGVRRFSVHVDATKLTVVNVEMAVTNTQEEQHLGKGRFYMSHPVTGKLMELEEVMFKDGSRVMFTEQGAVKI